MWGVLLLSVLINTVFGATIPALEILFLFFHIVGFFAILIPLIYMAPHGSPHQVFTLFNNGGGWSSSGLSFFVGLQGSAVAIIGTLPTALDGMQFANFS